MYRLSHIALVYVKVFNDFVMSNGFLRSMKTPNIYSFFFTEVKELVIFCTNSKIYMFGWSVNLKAKLFLEKKLVFYKVKVNSIVYNFY